LRQAGATAVFNIYTEAGAGFADHVEVNNQVRKEIIDEKTD